MRGGTLAALACRAATDGDDGGTASPRRVTRGESGQGTALSIDWLSFTFPMGDHWLEDLRNALCAGLKIRDELKQRPGGMLGYAFSGTIGPVTVAWGGDATRETVYVSIPGAVTGAVSAQEWEFIAQSFADLGGRITRIDCAFDDFDGQHVTVRKAVKWYKAGQFTNGGRPPTAQLIDDMGSNRGCTFYVGNRKNGKLLRVYEKGKQTGSETSRWVRVELQLGNRDRFLPWDLLKRPGAVLSGAYPALAFISDEAVTIKAVKLSHLLKLAHCIKHAKLQAGPVLYALLRLEGPRNLQRIVDQVIAYGRFPKRLDPSQLTGLKPI